MGQYLTLLAYHLANDEIIPYDLPAYTTAMRSYYDELLSTINGTSGTVDTSELAAAIAQFETSAKEVMALMERAVSTNDAALKTVVNHKFRDFQRAFTSAGGLPDREFYKHVVNAPGIDTGYAPTTFPGITEAVVAGNFDRAAEWVGRTSLGIRRAADILKT
ncbi:MAG: hypothetical protein L6R42_004921 [Xanthoria sp. 1 TBL-2021]|nr:MAG: hypothetical protein L6R42_004921 [Xanthoria sp. 1 TBL-2021]